MGIEDLDVSSLEFQEKLGLLCFSESRRALLSAPLKKRGYALKHFASVESLAEDFADEFLDLLVLDCLELPSEEETELESLVTTAPLLSAASLILLHPTPETCLALFPNIPPGRISVASSAVEPAQLLVRVSTALRLRKLGQEETKLQSRIALQNAELRDLTLRFQKELREAQLIQQNLLPQQLPYAPDCLLAAVYVPLEAVGGDMYDAWLRKNGDLQLFLGDVSGHGLPAAFIGAMTKLGLTYSTEENPAELLSALNVSLAPLLPEGRFITAIQVCYSPDSGQLELARAGHPPALVYRKDTDSVEYLEPRGLPLAVAAEIPYATLRTTLQPGDKLLLFTDGLHESIDMNGELFGLERLGEIFLDCSRRMTLAEAFTHILETEANFRGERQAKDDITLLGVERLG